MELDVDLSKFRYSGEGSFDLSAMPNAITPLYVDKDDYKEKLESFQDAIDELQEKMYAHDRYAMLLIFQAMDAAGKDSTIASVMRGVNPHGIKVHAFKQPSDEELDHGFMWRTNKAMPERGRITVFNRSYYEEVLIVRVHPEIVTKYQRLPEDRTEDLDALWTRRYRAINAFERYLHEQGTIVVKFFLNISRDEQRARFIRRIDKPNKNWKFAAGDVKERQHWSRYMEAYEACIDATASPHAPWYAIPADDKKNMRLMVSQAILDRMRQLDLQWPQLSEAQRAKLADYRAQLEND